MKAISFGVFRMAKNNDSRSTARPFSCGITKMVTNSTANLILFLLGKAVYGRKVNNLLNKHGFFKRDILR